MDIRPIAIALVAALCISTGASAESLNTRLAQVDVSQFPEIGLLLTVFTEAGKPVPGLTKDSFSIEEDGARVVTIDVQVAKAPISIALVLDFSGSMAASVTELKLAAGEFLRNLETRDQATIVRFSDRAEIASPLTADRRTSLDAIEALKSEGATALYDAVHLAVDELRTMPGRRLAVVFTDGRDQNQAGTAPQSAYSARAVAKHARDSQVPLWTIGLGKDVDRTLLTKLADLTGGRSYQPTQAGQLRKAFARVLADVHLQYRVSYRTPKDRRDGTTRRVTVTSSSQGRTGQGQATYVAPAPVAPASSASPSAAAPEDTQRDMQVGWVECTGFGGLQAAKAYRHGAPAGEAPVAETNLAVKRQLTLAPGKYDIVVGSSHRTLGRFTVDVKTGETVTIRGTGRSFPRVPRPRQ